MKDIQTYNELRRFHSLFEDFGQCFGQGNEDGEGERFLRFILSAQPCAFVCVCVCERECVIEKNEPISVGP